MSFRPLKHYPNEGRAYSFDIAQDEFTWPFCCEIAVFAEFFRNFSKIP